MLFVTTQKKKQKTGECDYKEAIWQEDVGEEEVPAGPPSEEDISREEEDNSETEPRVEILEEEEIGKKMRKIRRDL